MNKKSVFFLGISVLILAIMLWLVGIDDVIVALAVAKLELIALAIAVQVFTYGLYTLRWQILNNLADIDTSFKKLFPMILVGLAFLADVKIIQKLADKFIDPVKILTFGRSDIHHWHWHKVLFPCIVMFLAFALFLNGNLIMLVQSLAKWYGVVSEWVQQVL